MNEPVSTLKLSCYCIYPWVADLPLSPGTAAMHMILAEQTAIQASTVGSSLMFNRHTWRETEKKTHIRTSVKQFFQKARGIKGPSKRSPLSPSVDGCAVFSHLSDVSVTVAHPHLTATVGTAVAGRGARKLGTNSNTWAESCTSVNTVRREAWTDLNSWHRSRLLPSCMYTDCTGRCSHLHSATSLHYRNGLQKLRVPLVLIHR